MVQVIIIHRARSKWIEDGVGDRGRVSCIPVALVKEVLGRYFSYFSRATYVVGAHQKCLLSTTTYVMGTH